MCTFTCILANYYWVDKWWLCFLSLKKRRCCPPPVGGMWCGLCWFWALPHIPTPLHADSKMSAQTDKLTQWSLICTASSWWETTTDKLGQCTATAVLTWSSSSSYWRLVRPRHVLSPVLSLVSVQLAALLSASAAESSTPASVKQ